jgi:molybdenum cofactor guanylyltransferase
MGELPLALALGLPEKSAMRLAALILAGGRSSRMGRAKESLPLAGDTLLGHCCRQVGTACAPVLVMARSAEQALPPLPAGVERLADATPDPGPLPALLQAIDHLRARNGLTDDDAVLMTGCDMPFWTTAIVRGLAAALGDSDLIMPRADGVPQALAAIYRVRLRPAIVAAIAAGERAPKALLRLPGCRELDELAARSLDPELRFLRNINTPADYDAALTQQRRLH